MKILFRGAPNQKREAYSCLRNFYLSRSISLLKGQINSNVWKAHGITSDEIQRKSVSIIRNKLENNVNFEKLKSKAQSLEDLKIARSVKTNLTQLKSKQIMALINQAEIMTEIQIKLYIPELCIKQNSF